MNNKKNIYLVGAGDFGREMESWLVLLPEFHDEWEIIGYLDNRFEVLNNYPSDFTIVGTSEDFIFTKNDYVLICVASPMAKKRISLNLKGRVQFFTYIAPSALIGKFVKIGVGCIICPNVIVSTNTSINDFVTINLGSHIGHDCKIGAFSSIMANVDLGGHVEVGENVFFGTNSTAIPKIKISENIVVGAGAIITRNLKKEGTYFGNPASLLKF